MDPAAAPSPSVVHRRAVIKAVALLVFVAAAVVLVRFTAVKDFLTAEGLSGFLAAAGLWAPLVFILIYAVGVCLFVPGSILTGLGAVIFGTYLGFVYVWLGAMIGASVAFLIGRTLGREFAASLVGDRLRKYDDVIARNGFAAVLYLRLIYFPFTPMNFGMGLTRVSFKDYFFGTGLGILVGTFIFTFFFGSLKEIWSSGNWAKLMSFKVFFAVGLFIFSFFIPRLINTLRGRKGRVGL
jgi:uncharacterized membrane protein YdjX (TVP38/TMEM64 family)